MISCRLINTGQFILFRQMDFPDWCRFQTSSCVGVFSPGIVTFARGRRSVSRCRHSKSSDCRIIRETYSVRQLYILLQHHRPLFMFFFDWHIFTGSGWRRSCWGGRVEINSQSSSFAAINPLHYPSNLWRVRKNGRLRTGFVLHSANPKSQCLRLSRRTRHENFNWRQRFAWNLCPDRDHHKIYCPNFHVVTNC